MANQRKKGIERVTLTLPDELLAKAEQEATRRGIDRLSVIREAIQLYLGSDLGEQSNSAKTSSKKSK
jgi:metal-responsive CopG/Arc/MetJ family transcriptional regulator